jgi:hypothetical protein
MISLNHRQPKLQQTPTRHMNENTIEPDSPADRTEPRRSTHPVGPSPRPRTLKQDHRRLGSGELSIAEVRSDSI